MEESRLCQWIVIRSLLAILQWWDFNVIIIIMNKWIFQGFSLTDSSSEVFAKDLLLGAQLRHNIFSEDDAIKALNVAKKAHRGEDKSKWGSLFTALCQNRDFAGFD